MTELNRQQQLTTADFAARSNFADSNLAAEAANADYAEDYIAADPRRPRLVQTGPIRTDGESDNLPTASAIGTQPARDWESNAGPGSYAAPDTAAASLFSDTDIGDLRSRWSDVQAAFVDEPRRSVEQADQLVATVMQRMAEGFANERASLERQWDSGDNVSTEELRVALQRYRSFFGRLLNAA